MGYIEGDKKIGFEDIKKFFKNSYLRQPCPANILFHNVYVKVCDKIINEHFYRDTSDGQSYSNFNRHIGSHLLSEDEFATKENCIRLFILLDTMSEIYLYETKVNDPRFELGEEQISYERKIFEQVILDNVYETAEQVLLGITKKDIFNDDTIKQPTIRNACN